MGVLDKLLFWRGKTTETQLDIEGCFTLPGAEIGVSSEPVVDRVASEVEQPADQAPAD